MLARKNILKISDYFGKKAPRPERIIKNADFSIKIFRSDKSYHRFGVVLSTSLDKRSTVRNRLKRVVLAFFGLNINKLPVFDYVFFPSKKMTTMTKNEIIELLKIDI